MNGREKRIALSSLPFVLVTFSAGSLRAETSSAAAEALFVEARSLLESGRTKEACDKFAASRDLEPAPGTLLNLAGCYEKLGKTASAWVTFQKAAAASRAAGKPDWITLAETRASKLEPELARIKLVWASSKPPDAKVRLDESELGEGALGSPLPVDPGTHTLTVLSSDGASVVRTVLAEPKTTTLVELPAPNVEAKGPARPRPVEPDAPASPHPPPLFFAFSAAAVGTAALGGTFLGLREETIGRMTGGCTGHLTDALYTRCDSLRSEAGRNMALAIVGFAAAGAFATAATITWFASKPKDSAKPAVTIACAPSFFTIACQGSY